MPRATDATKTLNVSTADGKYTVVCMSDGTSHALRYGESWQVFPEGGSVGNLAMAFAFEVERLRKDLANMQEVCERAQAVLEK